VEIRPQTGTLLAYVKVNPDSVSLEDGFLRDVRHIGHFGTGDLEITIDSDEALERAKPFLVQSYDAS
jgi:predicted transport protein